MAESATRYPLAWPAGRPRTSPYSRKRSKFKTTFAVARDLLFKQVAMLGGRNAVMSTNVELRGDGIPYANRRDPDDQGVAMYFDYKGKSVCFACDCWDRIHDNMHAILKTIEALRGIVRWGSGDMRDAAFTGYTALPPARQTTPWWETLGVVRHAPEQVVHDAYRQLAMKHHPDRGGSPEMMVAINVAYGVFKKELGT